MPSNFEGKYGLVTFDCIMDIFNHMKSFVPQNDVHMVAFSQVISRMIDAVSSYYKEKKFSYAKSKLYKIYDVIEKLPDLQLRLGRKSRFFFIKNRKLTNNLYVFLSILNKI